MRYELCAHQKSVCAPTLRSHTYPKTFGIQARHPAPGNDAVRCTNMPVIPRHPMFFEHPQREYVPGNNSVITPGSINNTHTIRRNSVPPATTSSQSRFPRSSSGPSLLFEENEVDVVWSSMGEQNDSIHRMDQVIREEILPGEMEFFNIIRGLGSARKDPDTICIHCGGSFANC